MNSPMKSLSFDGVNTYVLTPDAKNVIEDAEHKFVTDAEKTKWDGKAEKNEVVLLNPPNKTQIIHGVDFGFEGESSAIYFKENLGSASQNIELYYSLDEASTTGCSLRLRTGDEGPKIRGRIGNAGDGYNNFITIEDQTVLACEVPPTCPEAPTTSDELTNKAYVDSKLPDLTQYYTKAEVDAMFAVDSTTLV